MRVSYVAPATTLMCSAVASQLLSPARSTAAEIVSPAATGTWPLQLCSVTSPFGTTARWISSPLWRSTIRTPSPQSGFASAYQTFTWARAACGAVQT